MNTEIEKIRVIKYIRVSTQEQGISNLGLKAQNRDIDIKINQLKREFEITNLNNITIYKDIASGKDIKNRPELQKALIEIEKKNTYLIVQKIDRLTRNLKQGINIYMENKGKIFFSNLNTNDYMIIAIFLAQAQKEREQISLRTKKALQELKLSGVKLGRNYKKDSKGKNLKGQNEKAISIMNRNRTEKAREYVKNIYNVFYHLIGNLTYGEIAKWLNVHTKYKTYTNKKFHSYNIYNIVKKYKELI